MERLKKFRASLAFMVLLVVTVLGVDLWNPRVASTDATGCTLYTNTYPASAGTCSPKNGSNCYICEYSSGSGIKTCAEYPDGSSPKCRLGPFVPSPNP